MKASITVCITIFADTGVFDIVNLSGILNELWMIHINLKDPYIINNSLYTFYSYIYKICSSVFQICQEK